MDKKTIETRHVETENLLVDLLTEPFGKPQVEFMYCKLGKYDIYASV